MGFIQCTTPLLEMPVGCCVRLCAVVGLSYPVSHLFTMYCTEPKIVNTLGFNAHSAMTVISGRCTEQTAIGPGGPDLIVLC